MRLIATLLLSTGFRNLAYKLATALDNRTDATVPHMQFSMKRLINALLEAGSRVLCCATITGTVLAV